MRQKLQNTANLYKQQADFKHFGAKSQFEQKSFPLGKTVEDKATKVKIDSKSKTERKRYLFVAKLDNCITVPSGREKVNRQMTGWCTESLCLAGDSISQCIGGKMNDYAEVTKKMPNCMDYKRS